MHDVLDAMDIPVPHVPLLLTVGRVHGAGLQVYVVGVSTAAQQNSAVIALGAYPATQAGVHVSRLFIVVGVPMHAPAPFVMVGLVHGCGTHFGAVPLHVPVDVHVNGFGGARPVAQL